MAGPKTNPSKSPEVAWLSDVTETRQPLCELRPIWVRHSIVHSGRAIPHPERHPYCEFGCTLRGRGTNFIGHEEVHWVAGDLFLVGPGVPHWGVISSYPVDYITIYFIPSVLIDLGPESDGAIILRRFTAPRSVNDRLVHPPAPLQKRLTEGFQEIQAEFDQSSFGREINLRTLLMGLLVHLLRWERSTGPDLAIDCSPLDWQPVNRTLHYLREHYQEPVYVREVARAAGVSIARLNRLFHDALGMSWVRYLQGYRVHQAAVLLGESRLNVTETAFAVGFQSLSHFNAIFRSFMGVFPSGYARQSPAKKND